MQTFARRRCHYMIKRAANHFALGAPQIAYARRKTRWTIAPLPTVPKVVRA